MAGLKISILLLLASAIIGVSSLSCAPCDPDPAACDASKVLSCTAGIGKDVCGCCDVCSQALGENCGGPWNITGVCGNNLKCLKQPLQNNYVNSFNLEGKCVLEIPEFDSNWFNGFDLTGFGGIDFSGFGDSVFTLINGVTFLNGIEIVEGKDCYTACTGTYWPVCGSDGISYPNECALLNLQCVNPDLKVAQNAACGVIPSVDPVFCKKATCTREYRPVCGSDGKTYSNKCELNNAKCDDKALRMVHNSLCVKIVITTCKNLFCTKEYEPICASDGETYGNECLFNKAKCTDKTLIIVTRSVCESSTPTTTTYFKITINNGFDLSGFSGLLLSGFSGYSFTFENGLTLINGQNFDGSQCYTACTLIYLPVCGSDGNSYPNDCALQNAKCDNYNLYRRYNGKCEDVQYPEGTTCIMAKCKGNLDDSFKVCGSDGKIYASFCNFLNAKCKNDFLELADMGFCVGIVGPIECKSPCPFNYEPVCGTDGETYSNDCFLKNAICEDIFLIKKGDGPCDDCKSKICTDKYFTICGSDGRTYGSECLFKNAQCDNFSLQRKHNGECAEVIPFCVKHICLKYYQPVCGSDGKTYSSECYLNNAKCENNLLKLSYTGRCELNYRIHCKSTNESWCMGPTKKHP